MDPNLLFPTSDPWLASYLSAIQSRCAAEVESSLLLVVEMLDDLQALQASARHESVPPAWSDAVRVLRAKAASRAADLGLATVATIGHPLDPLLHVVDSTRLGEAPPETIVAEVRPGYLYQGRVIRPASVVTIGSAEAQSITADAHLPASKGARP